MLTGPGWEFHGREADLALVRGELELVADGAETVIVVEGAAARRPPRTPAPAPDPRPATAYGLHPGHTTDLVHRTGRNAAPPAWLGVHGRPEPPPPHRS